jgi:hypothetical protein
VPEFARYWSEEILAGKPLPLPFDTAHARTLISDMHLRGLNVRYLGLVLPHLKARELRQFVLQEMLARHLRTEVNGKLRALASSDRGLILNLYVDLLGLLLGGESSDVFWSSAGQQGGPITRGLSLHWNLAFTPEVATLLEEVRRSPALFVPVVKRAAEMLGLSLALPTADRDAYDLLRSGKLELRHISSLDSKVRPLHIFSFLLGYSALELAGTKDGENKPPGLLHFAHVLFHRR